MVLFQRVADCGGGSAPHMIKVTYAQGGTISHIPVSCEHNALKITGGKNCFFISLFEDPPVYFPVFFLPAVCLRFTGNGQGKNHIRILLFQLKHL